jgi:hypothetical protein
MYKVRRRLVNFRVTDEELEQLKNAATSQGSRCLSDFARATMLQSLNPGARLTNTESVDNRFAVLDRRLNVLEANVARLAGDSKRNGSVQEPRISTTI